MFDDLVKAEYKCDYKMPDQTVCSDYKVSKRRQFPYYNKCEYYDISKHQCELKKKGKR